MRISDMPLDTILTGHEYLPIVDPNEPNPSLRNKRVNISQIYGVPGTPGAAGASAYQVWQALGNTGTTQDFINSLKGTPGESTYQIWLDQGNIGNQSEFLSSLIGPTGASAYQAWLNSGNTGTQTDFVVSLKGATGNTGPAGSTIYSGTSAPSDQLGLNGDYYVNTTSGEFYEKLNGTYGTPLLILKGQTGSQGVQGIQGVPGPDGPPGSAIITGNVAPTSGDGDAGDYYLNQSTGEFFGPKDSVNGWPSTPEIIFLVPNDIGTSICPLVSGKVPAGNLPSYVDDVLEFANLAAFPNPGETSKIYIADDTNNQYRWSGTNYIQITASPGTTDNVPEGTTNLYFTPARVNVTVGQVAGLVKGSGTGVTSAAVAGTDYVAPNTANVFTNVQAGKPAYGTITGAVSLDLTNLNASTGVTWTDGSGNAATPPTAANTLVLIATANVSSFAVIHPVDGAYYSFYLVQDATGGRTFVIPTSFDFGAAGSPTLTTTANTANLISTQYLAGLSRFRCAASPG